jgi:hypothetical protein
LGDSKETRVSRDDRVDDAFVSQIQSYSELKSVEGPNSLARLGPIAAKKSLCLLVMGNEQACYGEKLAPCVGEKAAA